MACHLSQNLDVLHDCETKNYAKVRFQLKWSDSPGLGKELVGEKMSWQESDLTSWLAASWPQPGEGEGLGGELS